MDDSADAVTPSFRGNGRLLLRARSAISTSRHTMTQDEDTSETRATVAMERRMEISPGTKVIQNAREPFSPDVASHEQRGGQSSARFGLAQSVGLLDLGIV